MGKQFPWEEVYKQHPVKNNIINFLPLDKGEYLFFSPEEEKKALNIRELVKKRDEKGYKYVVVACDNRYALKMFAGAPDEEEQYFQGVKKFEGSMVASKVELENILKELGEEYQFFYPYPNYMYPLNFYSDRYLPKQGELTNNLRNFGMDRAVLFDESKAWDSIIRDGLFDIFANSFLVVIGPKLRWKYGRVIFSKFSNDRSEKFAIRTDICETDYGEKSVWKIPVGKVAREHIAKLATWQRSLEEAYPGFAFNQCLMHEYMAQLEYVEGRTLDEILVEFLAKGEREKAFAYIQKYVNNVMTCNQFNIIDVDLIFKNIVVSKNGKWTVIDYEWTFDKISSNDNFVQRLTNDFVIFRSLYYFVADNRLSDELRDELYALVNISSEKINEYMDLERCFQEYVSDGHQSLGNLYGEYRGHLFEFNQMIKAQKEDVSFSLSIIKNDKRKIDHSKYQLERMDDLCVLELDIQEDWDKLEIVPAYCDVMVDIRSICWDGEEKDISYVTNGELFYDHLYLFRNTEQVPKITIDLPRSQGHIQIQYTMRVQGNNTSATYATLCYNCVKQKLEEMERNRRFSVLDRLKKRKK